MNRYAIPKGTNEDKDVTLDVSGNYLVAIVDISDGDGSLVVTINGVSTSGYSYPLLISDSLTGESTTPLRVFPGATPSENAVANDVVPATVNISVEVTGDVTYGVDLVAGG